MGSFVFGATPKSFTLPPLGSGEAIGEKAFDYFQRGAAAGGIYGIFYSLTLQPSKLQSPRLFHLLKISARMSLWNAVIFSGSSLVVNLLGKYRGQNSHANWGAGGTAAALMYCVMAGSGKHLLIGSMVGFAGGWTLHASNYSYFRDYSRRPVAINADCSTLPPPTGLSLRDHMHYQRTRWQGRLPEKESPQAQSKDSSA